MQKVHPQQMAQALFQVTQNVSKNDIETVIDRMIGLATDYGLERKLPEILAIYQELVVTSQEGEMVHIHAKNPPSNKHVESIKKKIMGEYNLSQVRHQIHESDDMLGGIKVRFRDTVYDMSLKRSIDQLSESLTK